MSTIRRFHCICSQKALKLVAIPVACLVAMYSHHASCMVTNLATKQSIYRQLLASEPIYQSLLFQFDFGVHLMTYRP